MKNKKKNSTGYPTLNEYKSKKFLNIATAVGIGVSAAAITIDMDAGEEKVVEAKKTENPDQKKTKDQIILLVANLGHKDFKKREDATKSLLSIGDKLKEEKKTEVISFLKAELQKCCKSKDPEVKERSKKILLAITPKPPPINRRIHRTAGVMIQR